ncbi:hypothetical protein ACRYCC_39115 [Actinomadura scrupuli]|uniref:hypothetical protein n=1 Tax=Actinomadura scrupuli TaxID=559629 RepID=UPI003D996136
MSSWRQRLSEMHEAEAVEYLRSLGPDVLSDDDHETVLRTQWVESVKNYAPDAALTEELLVRLSGNNIEPGALDFKVGESLLKPLEDGISAAANQELKLEITGLSVGSTVLHVRATPATVSGKEEGALPSLGLSPANAAILGFIRLITAAESEGDLREWAPAYNSLDHLVQALDKFDLSLGLRWLSLSGLVRSTTLTGRGRQYVRSLRDTREEVSTIVVRGRVTELREAGVVKIKSGPSRTSAAYEVKVEREKLISMHLELGEKVAFLSRVLTKFDRLGHERSRNYFFLERVESQDSSIF